MKEKALIFCKQKALKTLKTLPRPLGGDMPFF